MEEYRRMGEAIGYMGLGNILGTAIGPSLGLATGATIGFRYSFLVGCGVIMAGFVCLLLTRPPKKTPEEIAVSIAAEMICEKQKQNGRYHFPDDIMDGILAVFGKQEDGEAHAVLATIISQTGSTPRKAGARMLVYPDGSASGTIGGGSMEGAVIRRAVQVLRDPSSFEPSLLTVDLTGRYGEYADMMCGGITEIFVELI